MAQGDRPVKKPFDPAKADQMKSDFIRGAKYAPFDLVGAPVDLTTMAMRGLGVPVPEKPFLSSEYLIDKYADLGEALDINYDRPTGSGMETLGRVMAGSCGSWRRSCCSGSGYRSCVCPDNQSPRCGGRGKRIGSR
jgi:hypothetical protein